MVKLKAKIRQATIADIPAILSVEKEAWGEEKAATRRMFESRLSVFPKGTLVAEINDRIVGVVVTERVNYNYRKYTYTWNKITDNGFIKKSHNPNGNTIYGVDLSVLPSFQSSGIGTELLESIGRLVIFYNVKQAMLGGRIPNYHKYADKMTVKEYIDATVDTPQGRKPLDPEVSFYQKAGLKIVKIIPNYFTDPESLNYGILLLWKNPFYNKWYCWIVAKIFKI